MAQTLTQELGEAANSEVRAWCEALEACAASYLRDAKVLFPWLRLGAQGATAIAEGRAEKSPEWLAIEPFFASDTTLADAPDRLEGAIRELAVVKASLASDYASRRER